MIRNLMMMVGLAKRPQSFWHRRGMMIAPFGGTLPLVAWFAWRNRDKISSFYRERISPMMSRRGDYAGASV